MRKNKRKNKIRSPMPDFTKILHENGASIAHIRHDTKTNEVFVSEDGENFERAHGWVREQITGIPYRDPGELDPVTSAGAMRDPIFRSIHEAKVKDMLLYLIDYYRPDLPRPANLPLLMDAMITVIGRSQAKLAALPTVYDRWDLIIENMVEWLIEPPRLVMTGPRQ